MSPYPPGTSAGDPRAPWNEPHAHDHEWRPVEDELIIEDGAAIFIEECRYAEGQFGRGWECEETRHYRFEYSTFETECGLEIELHDISEWQMNNEKVRDRIRRIEEAYHEHGPGDEVSIDLDPDPDTGQVTIKYNDWQLHYRA